jgi:aminopeptidase S
MWTQKFAGIVNSSASQPAYAGSWKAQLGGIGSDTNSWIYQIPYWPTAGGDRTLRFRLKIVTAETAATAVDRMGPRITNAANQQLVFLQGFTNLDAAEYADYTLVTITVPAEYCVPGNRLRFASNENATSPTIFLVDDVALY